MRASTGLALDREVDGLIPVLGFQVVVRNWLVAAKRS
jgi:hypothetical protein